ncbi:hypothetical protein, partial [Ruegeria atlantica]|uniref:hypothetical protein n=1 Tax=Ruegeria atlantica TaxID=81569 RepID=UPI001C2CB479
LRRSRRVPATASAAPVKGVLRITNNTRKWKIESWAFFLPTYSFPFYFKSLNYRQLTKAAQLCRRKGQRR